MRTDSTENSPVTMGGDASALSQDLDDLISSFSPQDSTGTLKSKEQSAIPRFRVKWHADIVLDAHNTHHGFINDISRLGASIYLDTSLPLARHTLHIHVP